VTLIEQTTAYLFDTFAAQILLLYPKKCGLMPPMVLANRAYTPQGYFKIQEIYVSMKRLHRQKQSYNPEL
jgi:hypothetical protein